VKHAHFTDIVQTPATNLNIAEPTQLKTLVQAWDYLGTADRRYRNLLKVFFDNRRKIMLRACKAGKNVR
jgi:hypothetical protein